MGESPLFGGDYAAVGSSTVSSQDGPRMTVNALMRTAPRDLLKKAVAKRAKKTRRGVKSDFARNRKG